MTGTLNKGNMKKLLTIGLLLAFGACSGKPKQANVFYVPVSGVGMIICKEQLNDSDLRDCQVNGFTIPSVLNPQNVLVAPADLGQ